MKPRPRLIGAGAATFIAAATAYVGQHEGRMLTAYQDVSGVWTICNGDTKNVRQGQKATDAECDERLLERLIEHEAGMLKCLRVELPPHAHLAFLSLTYNIGVDAFCGSTAARRINAGDLVGACDQILRWNRAGGVVWRGLDSRRKSEREICRKDVEEK
jgi:GH24 family phage-related lysozyme (muramidase)